MGPQPTTPAPAPPAITLAVLDPISADVTTVCQAITAVCNLLSTPAGQKLLEAELEAGSKIEAAVTKTFSAIFNGIASLFGKRK